MAEISNGLLNLPNHQEKTLRRLHYLMLFSVSGAQRWPAHKTRAIFISYLSLLGKPESFNIPFVYLKMKKAQKVGNVIACGLFVLELFITVLS
jgi:hypothetical protein